jgi:hypothetical protein
MEGLLDQILGHARRHVHASLQHFPDGKHQLFSHRLLEDIPGDTRSKRFRHEVLLAMHGEYEQLHVWSGFFDLSAGIQSVEERKRDVHKRNIRPVTLNGLHKGSTVRDSSAQFTLTLQQFFDTFSHECMVVSDEDSGFHDSAPG